MDLLNSVSQCHFCTHLNTAFAPHCELCHELLSVQNMLLTTELMSVAAPPAFCTRCTRRLLHNQRTCAFCNAHWAGTPISRLTSLDNLHLDLIRLTFLPSLITVDGPALPHQERVGLSAEARQQFLAPIPIDSSCTTALCPVCLDVVAASVESEVEVVQLPCCRNRFHATCVQPWFNAHFSCPTCRRDLNAMVTN